MKKKLTKIKKPDFTAPGQLNRRAAKENELSSMTLAEAIVWIDDIQNIHDAKPKMLAMAQMIITLASQVERLTEGKRE